MTKDEAERVRALAAQMHRILEGKYYSHEALTALALVAAIVAVDEAVNAEIAPGEAVDSCAKHMRLVMHQYANFYALPEPGEVLN